MFTDDPGTPGNGRFELNLGGTFESDSRQQSWTLPTFDLNYGVGPHIQMNLATSFVLQKESRGGPVGGLGAARAAVKWRFLDQGSNGYSVWVFPRIERSVLRSSVWRVAASDLVRQGDENGVVGSLFGDTLEKVFSPVTGRVVFLTINPAVSAGGLLMGIGVSEAE